MRLILEVEHKKNILTYEFNEYNLCKNHSILWLSLMFWRRALAQLWWIMMQLIAVGTISITIKGAFQFRLGDVSIEWSSVSINKIHRKFNDSTSAIELVFACFISRRVKKWNGSGHVVTLVLEHSLIVLIFHSYRTEECTQMKQAPESMCYSENVL